MNKEINQHLVKIEKTLKNIESKCNVKNEFLGLPIGKLDKSDSDKFVSKLFKSNSKLNNLVKKDNINFNNKFGISLQPKDKDTDNLVSFLIGAIDGSRSKIYCKAIGKNDTNLAKVSNIDFDSKDGFNKIASFINSQIEDAKQRAKNKSKSESRYVRKYENIQLTTLDCERLKSLIEYNLDDYDVDVDVTDDNADYGFINVGIICNDNDKSTEYNIEQKSSNTFVVKDEFDDKVCNCVSLNDVAFAISDNFRKNFIL